MCLLLVFILQVNKGLIPNLKNVAVFVCGATVENNQQYRIYKQFWQKFFSRAGANLYNYGYGNYERVEDLLYEVRKMDRN